MVVALVVCIRKMRMDMHHRLVAMRVGMLGSRWYGCFMRVLMMLVMNMLMAVLHGLVGM